MSTARVARSVKLDPEIDARLTALAQRTGRTKSFYMNRAIESALEEIELAYSLQAELEDIRAGRVASVSLDEAVKTLDLEGCAVTARAETAQQARQADRETHHRLPPRDRERRRSPLTREGTDRQPFRLLAIPCWQLSNHCVHRR